MRSLNRGFGKQTILLPRRPLVGLGDWYEITRHGHLYSKRLKRMIRHRWSLDFEKDFIQLQVAGQTYNIGIHYAIADSWLEAAERAAILADLATNSVEVAAARHNLRAATVHYLRHQQADSA